MSHVARLRMSESAKLATLLLVRCACTRAVCLYASVWGVVAGWAFGWGKAGSVGGGGGSSVFPIAIGTPAFLLGTLVLSSKYSKY